MLSSFGTIQNCGPTVTMNEQDTCQSTHKSVDTPARMVRDAELFKTMQAQACVGLKLAA
jgi:hypothetical protein